VLCTLSCFAAEGILFSAELGLNHRGHGSI